jgi:hypothetical protein
MRILELILLAALLFGSASAADDGLDQLLSMLAQRQHGHVQFIEQEFLAVLDHPLESSGELRYDAPDRLEKRTLAPRPETLLLAGGVLTIVSAGAAIHREHPRDVGGRPGGVGEAVHAGVCRQPGEMDAHPQP